MSENPTRKCPRCGTELPPGPAGAICPRCAADFLQASATDAGAAGEGKHAFTPPAPAELQAKFPQLEILSFIGQGGMGAVYQARQRQLDRVVALKILPPGIGDDPAFAERFAREAKAMARLNHPGIVTIHDFGRADGLFYFLMEFVDGVSLAQLMQAGRVSPREALAIVPQICDALQYAHDQGLVHRDIKPENILLDRRGRVKVADFGLVKLIEGSSEPAAPEAAPPSPDLTQAGKVLGTPRYMAPEQVEHPTGVDHRADIYALGVVFYQMLTGELPGKPLQAPSKKVQVDVRLDEVVLRALEKEPERRYQQASQIKTAVETVASATVRPNDDERSPVTLVAQASEPAVSPTSESAHRPPASPHKRSRRSVIMALLFGLVLVLGLGLLFAIRQHAPQPPSTPLSVLAYPASKGDVRVYFNLPASVVSSNSVDFSLTQDLVPAFVQWFRAGKRLPVRAYSGTGQEFGSGFVTTMDDKLDPQTGTLKCTVRLVPVQADLMVPGMYLMLRFVGQVKHDVIRVPADAVEHDPQSAFVWVITPQQTVAHRAVAVGTVEDPAPIGSIVLLRLMARRAEEGSTNEPSQLIPEQWAEIQSGVSPGELVVIRGQDDLLKRHAEYGWKVTPEFVKVVEPPEIDVQRPAATDSSRAPQPPERLSQSVLTQLLDSNRIAQVTISPSPGTQLAEVTGRYSKLENNASIEVAFRATVRLTPALEKKLLDAPQVSVKTKNPSLLGWDDSPANPATNQKNLVESPPAIPLTGNRELLEAQYHQAETEFALAEKLHEAKAVSDTQFEAAREKVDVLKAALDGDPIRAAQIRLESAERRLQRLSLLYTNKLISASELDPAQLEVQQRRIELKAADAQARFEPVITRTLRMNGHEGKFLVLRTGEVLHHSVDTTEIRDQTPPTVFMQWVRSNGVDLGFCFSTNKFYPPLGLITFDMGTAPFPSNTVLPAMIPNFSSVAELEDHNATHSEPAKSPLIGPLVGVTNIWNDLKAAQLEDPPEGPAFFLREKHFAMCFACTNSMPPIAFCTRDGRRGLLQVTAFTSNPATISLRYKLVARADTVQGVDDATPIRRKEIPEWVVQKQPREWLMELQSPDANVRNLAQRAIHELSTNCLPEVLRILRSREAGPEARERRYHAASALSFIGPTVESAFPAFVALLNSGYEESAYAGASALAFSTRSTPEAVTYLTNGLVAPSPGVRDAATYGIGLWFGMESNHLAESVLPALLHNLKDEAQFVRADTVNALMFYVQAKLTRGQEWRADLLIPPLIPLLQDSYSYARDNTAQLLSNSRQKAVPILRNLLSSSDRQIRECATNALNRLGERP